MCSVLMRRLRLGHQLSISGSLSTHRPAPDCASVLLYTIPLPECLNPYNIHLPNHHILTGVLPSLYSCSVYTLLEIKDVTAQNFRLLHITMIGLIGYHSHTLHNVHVVLDDKIYCDIHLIYHLVWTFAKIMKMEKIILCLVSSCMLIIHADF